MSTSQVPLNNNSEFDPEQPLNSDYTEADYERGVIEEWAGEDESSDSETNARVESKPVRLTPEEVRARFPEIACQFVRQQIISAGIPKAQAIEILKKEAAKNDIDLSDDDAGRHYDAAWRQRQRDGRRRSR